jgi:hypothetical protein
MADSVATLARAWENSNLDSHGLATVGQAASLPAEADSFGQVSIGSLGDFRYRLPAEAGSFGHAQVLATSATSGTQGREVRRARIVPR